MDLRWPLLLETLCNAVTRVAYHQPTGCKLSYDADPSIFFDEQRQLDNNHDNSKEGCRVVARALGKTLIYDLCFPPSLVLILTMVQMSRFIGAATSEWRV